MNNLKTAATILLLSGVLIFTGAGILGQFADAKPIGCSSVGCPGGADRCMSIDVGIKGISIGITCYVRVDAPVHQD